MLKTIKTYDGKVIRYFNFSNRLKSFNSSYGEVRDGQEFFIDENLNLLVTPIFEDGRFLLKNLKAVVMYKKLVSADADTVALALPVFSYKYKDDNEPLINSAWMSKCHSSITKIHRRLMDRADGEMQTTYNIFVRNYVRVVNESESGNFEITSKETEKMMVRDIESRI